MKQVAVLLYMLAAQYACLAQMSERIISGGVMYKSSGLGLAYQTKQEIRENLGKQIDIEFSSFHHPRETKTFNPEINNPTPFVFGKMNRAAILKMCYSLRYKVSSFSDAQRIGVDLGLGGGISVGLLRPVYINLIYPDPAGYEVVVTEKYDPQKHTDKTRIAGYADGRLGWNELSYKAGINLSAGVGFTWGYFTNYPRRLETGFYIDAFRNGLPVMAFVPKRSFEEGVFVKLLVGKRNSKN